MRRPQWIRLGRQPGAVGQRNTGLFRDRLALMLALVTFLCLSTAFVLSKGTHFLMPGPLTSAHGAIDKCDTCHTHSGSGKLSWIHGLVANDPRADSKACLTCHKMPDTAFNPHGASAQVLKQSTQRLTKIAAGLRVPQSARAQSIAFPTGDLVARGLNCAACHQEHQGANFNLNKISGEQCRSCHVVKFDSFEGQHPKFDNYPFKRRTRIIYDHVGHFGKHYPDVAKKDPAKRIPATCAICHNSRDDKQMMAVAPFEQSCSACHLDQINGKERVSGPKGIAFLTLPGLDLQTLKKNNASIGEWPDASDATLTPFMKVMISRNVRGRAVIKALNGLNLQDLAGASGDQLKAVTNLVWEIKALFHALIAGKASDVLGDLNIGGGSKLSASLVADLTASIPRDVVVSAQQQWLPALATEMANRKVSGDQENDAWNEVTPQSSPAGPASPEAPASMSPSAGGAEASAETSGRNKKEAAPTDSADGVVKDVAKRTKRDPQPCVVRVFGQCLMFKAQQAEAEAAKPERADGQSEAEKPKPGRAKDASSAGKLPPAMRAGLGDVKTAGDPAAANGKTNAPNAQSDDLLFPTEDELREIKAHTKSDTKAGPSAGPSDEAAGKPSAVSADTPTASSADTVAQTMPVSVISIESGVDPESWAEYGGWYRQDYGIFYRPTGHKDKFIFSWLFLTGPQATRNATSPVAAVFEFLTGKDAQGSCTKCHSVDDIPGRGRVVNFSQPSAKDKLGSFTWFVHEPHFGIMDDRGCLSCHKFQNETTGGAAEKADTGSVDAASKADAAVPSEKAASPYLKSYEQGDPRTFLSSFGAIQKDLCQTCHTSNMARQDCLTCHKYHVNGVLTPAMTTKIPMQK